MAHAEREVRIRNKLGMHARAAVKFVQTANTFKSDVTVVKDGQEANGKSIMGLLTLVAAHGVTMTVMCDGDDAQAAVTALAELVGTGFGEGVDPCWKNWWGWGRRPGSPSASRTCWRAGSRFTNGASPPNRSKPSCGVSSPR